MTSTTRGKEAAAAAATVEATLGARVTGRAMDEGARRTKMTARTCARTRCDD